MNPSRPLHKSSVYFLTAVWFILACFQPANAQKQGRARIDSIFGRLNETLADTTRVRMLSRLGFEYNSISSDSVFIYAGKAMALAEKINWPIGKTMGLNTLGLYYTTTNDFAKALTCYTAALQINDSIGNKLGSSANLVNIGVVYANLKEDQKAIHYYFRSLFLAKEIKRHELIALNLLNLGKANFVLKKYRRSWYFLNEGLKVAEANHLKRELAYMYKNLGILYLETHLLSQAEFALMQSISLNTELRFETEVANAYSFLGKLHRAMASHERDEKKQNRLYKQALKEELLSLGIYGVAGNKLGLTETYENLAFVYGDLHQYDSAFFHLRTFITMRDSVFSIENQRKIAHIESEKEFAIKDTEIQFQKDKAKAQLRYFSWGLGFLLLFTLLLFRERRKSDKLLRNILPASIAKRLKGREKYIADHFTEVSIVFIDIAGFTPLSSRLEPLEIVNMLNRIFTEFDLLSEKYHMEKIKTIGDCYMAVSGLPVPDTQHATHAAAMALEVVQKMPELLKDLGLALNFRIGMDCGPVVAGVIGKNKFTYDLWGDAVNVASRMESTGVEGEIHCTSRFKEKAGKEFYFISKGYTHVKGKGEMETWLLKSQSTHSDH